MRLLQTINLAVSAISFWEIAMLIAQGSASVDQDPPPTCVKPILKAGINEIPLTGDIAIVAGGLDGLPGDPADRFIVGNRNHSAMRRSSPPMPTLLKWSHEAQAPGCREIAKRLYGNSATCSSPMVSG